MSGQPGMRTRKPAKADHPRSLWKSVRFLGREADVDCVLVEEHATDEEFYGCTVEVVSTAYGVCNLLAFIILLHRWPWNAPCLHQQTSS